MFHFTIFGASEVTLSGQGQCIVTLFGGTEVRKPTLAKRLMQERHALSNRKSDPDYNPNNVDKVLNVLQGNTPTGLPRTEKRHRTFLLTIFGAVELRPPSIAEEFMDMRELVSSGLIDVDEWDQLVGRLYQMDDLDSVSSFTLFGGMGEVAINQEEEITKIHSAVGLGLIAEDEARALRSVVGRDPQQVRMLLRQTAFA